MGPDELTTTVSSETEIGPISFDTPIIHISNPPNWDADGDIAPSQLYDGTVDATEIAQPTITYATVGTGANAGPINIVQEGIMSHIFNNIEQRIRIGNLDLSDPESFYDFLKMWPLYNDNGQVIGLFDTKEHRDQAQERLEMEKLKSKPRINRLQQLLKKSTS